MYNGEIAFDTGRKELNTTFVDNYWELLPIERLTVSEEIQLDSENKNPNFEKAEEKAVKAIQKHGMQIKGEERNYQIDEAFLLLGKARYFDQRFVPALEAFNYILYKYPKSNKLVQASIWREKINIRLDNNELAIKNLKRLLKQEELATQEYADATAMLSQAYINLKHLDSSLITLKIAANYTKVREEEGRYNYIIGQVYNRLGKKDSADFAFDKVIALNRKSPRAYMINAYVQKAINFDAKGDSILKAEQFELLTKLEENRENRPFLDKIYRQVAAHHFSENNDSLAVAYLNKSLRAAQEDRPLKAMDYKDLADFYFYEKNYKSAGAYYDSTLINIPKSKKQYRTIKKRFDNLEEVIKYEDIVSHNDSIITLFKLPKEKQIAFFNAYIEELKAKEEAEAKAREKSVNTGLATFDASITNTSEKGKFYFYNTISLGYGKTNFKTRWGDRVLEDNWRWSDKTVIENIEEDNAINEVAEETFASESELYTPEYYINKIPTDAKVIDSLVAQRNFSNYQLGLIYKEKFKEYNLAIGKLEAVLDANPEEKLIIPSKYNLYKIYSQLGSPLAESTKDDIIKNHANSRYATILKNPDAVLVKGEDNSPEGTYSKLYKKFENQEYEAVIASIEESVVRYNGDAIVPKFELLKATASGRLSGFDAYKEGLNYVALNYPNAPEGKEAQGIIANQLAKLEGKSFSDAKTGKWKVVYAFDKSDVEGIAKLTETINKSIKELARKKLRISIDVYSKNKVFLVVHSFVSREFALGYAEMLNINKNYKVDKENFIILSANYRVIQIHKNLEAYLK